MCRRFSMHQVRVGYLQSNNFHHSSRSRLLSVVRDIWVNLQWMKSQHVRKSRQKDAFPLHDIFYWKSTFLWSFNNVKLLSKTNPGPFFRHFLLLQWACPQTFCHNGSNWIVQKKCFTYVFTCHLSTVNWQKRGYTNYEQQSSKGSLRATFLHMHSK